MRHVAEALQSWLEAGGREIGEIHLHSADGGWELHHRDDHGRAELKLHRGAEAARTLAHYTDEGAFRPLKTAPNLRHGWRLIIADLADLRRALDFFYPAMLGVWLSQTRGELTPVPLRTTLGRQTGMYRVTQKITDARAQETVRDFCRTDGGCLKHILWPLDAGVPITTLPPEKLSPAAAPGAFPLLCHEACNLLVAQAREVVKRADHAS